MRWVGLQTYETGRRCAGKRYDQLSARGTPLDLRASEHRISDFGEDQLVAQVCHGEHDLGGINSLAWPQSVADAPSMPNDQVGC